MVLLIGCSTRSSSTCPFWARTRGARCAKGGLFSQSSSRHLRVTHFIELVFSASNARSLLNSTIMHF
ncbi:hypothetical protein GOP47_0022848 [Adiantum capillus-veneris]|uniref:Uncharacterized protein n=1 Tax=Adiantum capillus-veneris TaxID=13818 RepID=A0A9D4U846_ADICA|nr:hypothetical protein GOP47_0022848 [Adiantum capillus-veneris]